MPVVANPVLDTGQRPSIAIKVNEIFYARRAVDRDESNAEGRGFKAADRGRACRGVSRRLQFRPAVIRAHKRPGEKTPAGESPAGQPAPPRGRLGLAGSR